MKIDVPRKAYLGEIEIKPGEYLISISPESNKIILTGAGGETKLPAVRRPSKMPVKRPKVSFGPSMGDPFWIISYCLPPRTEYVAFIKMERRQGDDD